MVCTYIQGRRQPYMYERREEEGGEECYVCTCMYVPTIKSISTDVSQRYHSMSKPAIGSSTYQLCHLTQCTLQQQQQQQQHINIVKVNIMRILSIAVCK